MGYNKIIQFYQLSWKYIGHRFCNFKAKISSGNLRQSKCQAVGKTDLLISVFIEKERQNYWISVHELVLATGFESFFIGWNLVF